MRKGTTVFVSVFVAVLAFSVAGMAQGQASVPAPDGWGKCPRCENNKDRAEMNTKFKVKGHPSNPHDLTGVWGFAGVQATFRDPPPMTEGGKQQHAATMGDKNAAGEFLHSKDTDELKVVERWRRLNYGTIEAQITVVDPKTYTQPWVTPAAKVALVPGTELSEYFCAPSDFGAFNDKVFLPTAGSANKK